MAKFNGETLGIIGGCGVAAAIELLHRIEKKLVTERGCTDDPEQPEMILYQATQAPNRIAYASGQSDLSFAPYFIRAAKSLKQSGATVCCIPCNTAHCVADEIERESGLPFINLIDETVKYIANFHGGVENIGLLCSVGTARSKIHDRSSRKLNVPLKFTYPSDKFQAEVSGGICAVKAGIMYRDPEAGREIFTAAMDELVANGAEIIVLGCTEIPLAIAAKMHGNVPIADTISILADACIDRCMA
ncbi:MAG: amino acid racemase [Puniceicoccales bacterium]|jgi:aspartate racemase|nr:amino acid racemase [Puniceicoccales bacterium]